MSIGYAVAYAVGVTPWERAGEAGADQLARLFAREETELGGPGRALDLGCGSGAHTLSLAERGWDATGVDQIAGALRRARRRAGGAAAAATFVPADVTALDPDRVGSGYHFFLDVGCFHGLTDEQRAAMGRSVTGVAAERATLLMLAFRPGATRRPLPRGADGESVLAAFPGWELVDREPAVTDGMPAPLRKAAPQWYRVRRRG